MTTTTASPFRTMTEVRAANKATGHHWFDRATMRFFRTRIESGLLSGRYFISSEQFVPFDGDPEPRLFTVRRVSDDGSVETEGEFQAYETKADARAAVAALIG